MATKTVTPDTLNSVMEFDHVIEVHADGTVSDAPGIRELWAPELTNERLDMAAPGWSLLSGYTGQQGGGNIMHNSEFIGGQLARDILAAPGYYVAIVANWLTEEDEEGEDVEGSDTVEGWAVAFKEPQGNAG
jgi:hypothetical protein